jgi:hypothetical protein
MQDDVWRFQQVLSQRPACLFGAFMLFLRTHSHPQHVCESPCCLRGRRLRTRPAVVLLWGQVLFSSLQGFYSMDCILDHNSSVPIAIQRVLVALLQPILLLLFSALFWLGW